MDKNKYINKIITIITTNANNDRVKFPELRKGQSLFNTVYKIFPLFCETITATIKDPFYNNGSIQIFMDSLHEYIHRMKIEDLQDILNKLTKK